MSGASDNVLSLLSNPIDPVWIGVRVEIVRLIQARVESRIQVLIEIRIHVGVHIGVHVWIHSWVHPWVHPWVHVRIHAIVSGRVVRVVRIVVDVSLLSIDGASCLVAMNAGPWANTVALVCKHSVVRLVNAGGAILARTLSTSCQLC